MEEGSFMLEDGRVPLGGGGDSRVSRFWIKWFLKFKLM